MSENEILVYDPDDAIDFIAARCNISRENIETVLELDLEYMRSVGIVS